MRWEERAASPAQRSERIARAAMRVAAKLLDPRGRERRSDFLYILACCISFPLALNAFVEMVGGLTVGALLDGGGILEAIGIALLLVSLVCAILILMAMIRRVHDAGRSGAALLTILIPYAGILWVLYYLFDQGVPFTNDYGPDPRGRNPI